MQRAPAKGLHGKKEVVPKQLFAVGDCRSPTENWTIMKINPHKLWKAFCLGQLCTY